MAMVDVTDPEATDIIEANESPSPNTARNSWCVAGRYELEGPTGNRHVLIEFESYDKALDCYHSPEYQHALKFRLALRPRHFVIVEGA